MILENSLQNFLSDLSQQGILRARPALMHPNASPAKNFCSNDYLGFSQHPEIRRFFQEGVKRYPSGSRGSLLIGGHHSAHEGLEQQFCEQLKCDAALLFSSGYTASLGITALLGRLQIPAIVDKALDPTLYDGLHLARARFERFPHQKLEQMKKKLALNAVILTEGIFSMSGYTPDLAAMAALARPKESKIMLDESHAFGVLGEQGLGSAAEAALTQDDVPLRMIPFGNAFAAMGAIVVGQQSWIDVLLQVARSCVYSTGISPAMAFGIGESFTYMRQASGLREKLKQRVAHFKNCIKHSGLRWTNSETPIQRLITANPQQARQYQIALERNGMQAQIIRYPNVCISETGLRFCIRQDHETQDIDRLFVTLNAQPAKGIRTRFHD